MRKMLTNAMWAVLKPHVAPTGRHACGAKPQVSDRVFLEARLDIARTGRLCRLVEALTDRPELGDLPRVFLDSTVLRAHAHAAGAPRKKSAPGPSGRRTPRASAAAGAGSVPRSPSR